MSIRNGEHLASFDVKGLRLQEPITAVLDLGVASSELVTRVSNELVSWFCYRPSPLAQLEHFKVSTGGRFVKRSDGTYELINRQEAYHKPSVIRRAAWVSHQRNAILEFSYKAGGVGPEHRHHVNVLRTDEKGFLGCKNNRIRSYLWAHVQWASTSLDPEVVSEEWAIVIDISPNRRGATINFRASTVDSGGKLGLRKRAEQRSSSFFGNLFGGKDR